MTDRWRPRTLDELRSFIDNGLAEEHHRIDFKREIPMGPRGNRELAKDLAAFAIDGGAIVVGVDEPKPNQFEVRPTSLDGLDLRVEQIARSRIDPPLWVESHTLPGDDDTGVLWIDVPSSPDGPHQTDGVYYERGDKQSRPMNDTAVERRMRARKSSLDDITNELTKALETEPFADSPRVGHTCLVAKPVRAAPDELYNAAGGQENWEAFARELMSAERIGNGNLSRFKGDPQPNWGMIEQPLASPPFGSQGSQLRLRDDGSLSYFTQSEHGREERRLVPGLTIDACLDSLAVLRFIGSKTGRRHFWDLAIAITRTEGAEAKSLNPDAFGVMPVSPTSWSLPPDVPFPVGSYVRRLRVTAVRLEQDPWGIVRDLTGRFTEGCGLNFQIESAVLGYEPPADT